MIIDNIIITITITITITIVAVRGIPWCTQC
jgi:hypothetical protein